MNIVLLVLSSCDFLFFLFFFNHPATTEIYTLSLHDALPILLPRDVDLTTRLTRTLRLNVPLLSAAMDTDRKSTRLNSSHANISYAVFCLKKKKHFKQKLSFTNQPFNNQTKDRYGVR